MWVHTWGVWLDVVKAGMKETWTAATTDTTPADAREQIEVAMRAVARVLQRAEKAEMTVACLV